jgi:hypothetical protein
VLYDIYFYFFLYFFISLILYNIFVSLIFFKGTMTFMRPRNMTTKFSSIIKNLITIFAVKEFNLFGIIMQNSLTLNFNFSRQRNITLHFFNKQIIANIFLNKDNIFLKIIKFLKSFLFYGKWI